MTQAKESVMTRIMKLMERAEHPGTPEAEAELCRQKADTLMAEHQIDRMDLTPEEKSRIVQDDWMVPFANVDYEFIAQVLALLREVLRHCGIRVVPQTKMAKDAEGRTDWNTRVVTMVGFPEEIAYAERIWFNVFKTFVSNVNPQWDTSKSLADNVYVFINAGYTWNQVREIAYNAVPDHYGIPPMTKPNSGGGKLLRAYREALAERGEEWSKTRRNKAYRSSFARSYASTIGERLAEMRRKTKETVSDADKFALALVDSKERVDAEFYRLFPEYDPEVQRRKAEQQTAEEAARFAALSPEEQAQVLRERAREEARWARRASRARSNYGRVRESDRTDMAAWERGRTVAKTVNLRADGEVKKDKKGELK